MRIKDNLDYISKHNSKVVKYIEPYFDGLIPYGIFLVFVSLVFEIFNEGFVWVNLVEDVAILTVLSGFYLTKNKISGEKKIKFILIVVFAMGMFVSYRNGFIGNGLYLCIASIITSLIFLNPSFALLMTAIFSVHVLFISQFRIFEKYKILTNSQLWVFQIIGIMTVCLISIITIFALKRYLIDVLLELEAKVERLKVANGKLKSKNSQIEHLAYIDQMTNLYNRQRFTYLVQNTCLKSGPGRLHVMDIANFKQINSFYGMEKGDEILAKIGTFFIEKFNERTMGGYFGANSFAVWSPVDTYLPSLQEFELELNRALDLSTFLHFYIVEIPTDEKTDIELLYKGADISINRMKREGKKRYLTYSEYDNQEMVVYDELVRKIEHAINEKLFTVYFQEKVDSRTEKVVGLEALARLIIDDEYISPGQFIPIIDDANLSIRFGRVIIEKVFDLYPKILEKYGSECVVSVNVSPQQLATASFIDEMKSLISMHAIDPTKLELEITENILIGDMESAVEIISKLKALGVLISIDDFGTGYSSLKYIGDLPIDVIKIDKSFIDRLSNDFKIEAVVKSIIRIAEVSNYHIIAEGVETFEQVERLKSLGCHLIQGYFYSKPKPL